MKISLKASIVALVLAAQVAAFAATEMPVRVTRRVAESQPAISEGFLAWEESSLSAPSLTRVFAKVLDGSPFRVHSRRSYGRMGGLDGSRLVYVHYRRTDGEGDPIGGELRMFDLATRERLGLPGGINTKREEFAPDVSGDWLLLGRARFGRRPNAEVLLRNLVTGETRVLAKSGGRGGVGPGQVNGMYASWYSCRRSACDVFRYNIASGETLQIPNPGGKLQYTPGVAGDGTVYFSRSGFGCGANVFLQKWTPIGGTVTLVDLPPRVDVDSEYVHDDPDSGRQIIYRRARCLKDKNAPPPTDLYQIID